MSHSKDERKQMIREYKERKKQIGIFAIRNKVTGRVLLDRTMNLDVAFNKHRFQLNVGSHRNKELQADWARYGEENFTYEVIDMLEDEPEGQRAIDEELDGLMELYCEKFAGMPGMNGLY